MARRDEGRARGRPAAIFFILFNFEKFVSAGPQAVCAAWVNIWGVCRVCGTLIMLIMFNVLFASYALARLFILRGFIFSKSFTVLLFDFLVEVSVCCVARENGVRVPHSPSQWGPREPWPESAQVKGL